jgi:hypothetical protein
MAATLLRAIGEQALANQRSKSTWAGDSLFSAMDELKPDYSGKVGELLLSRVCQIADIDHVYVDDDKNSKDGTYDIIILGKKIEVKTARLGVQGGFQHENLRDAGCDFHVFVDVKPAEFYVTVIPTFDMKNKHPVLGRKPHLRKGTSDVYKFDFGESNLLKAVSNGMTLKVSPDTSVETIGEFITRQIGRE